MQVQLGRGSPGWQLQAVPSFFEPYTQPTPTGAQGAPALG
jgi:hypothetical protein